MSGTATMIPQGDERFLELTDGAAASELTLLTKPANSVVAHDSVKS